MSRFTIGGASRSKAKDIPEGGLVRIVAAGFSSDSRFTQTIMKGPRAGQTVPVAKLTVELEYNGRAHTQRLGGVYANEDGSFGVTPGGGAGAFLTSLKSAGLPVGDEIASIVGLEFIATHRAGGMGDKAYDHIHAAKAAPNSTPAKATVAAKPAPVQAKAATPAATNAFTALPEADRALIQDATKDGTTLLPQELVEAGIAKDTTHASAILDGLKATQAPAPKLARK